MCLTKINFFKMRTKVKETEECYKEIKQMYNQILLNVSKFVCLVITISFSR
jgi:hypothetical protein